MSSSQLQLEQLTLLRGLGGQEGNMRGLYEARVMVSSHRYKRPQLTINGAYVKCYVLLF